MEYRVLWTLLFIENSIFILVRAPTDLDWVPWKYFTKGMIANVPHGEQSCLYLKMWMDLNFN